MSKPNNSISKIKLPGENTGRPIVPYHVGVSSSNTFIATLPALTADAEFIINKLNQSIDGTKTFNNEAQFKNGALFFKDNYDGYVSVTAEYIDIGGTDYSHSTYYNEQIDYWSDATHHYPLYFPEKTGTLAITDDIPDDSNLVHKGTNSSSITEIIYGEKKFGNTVRFGAYSAGATTFLSEGSISSSSLISMNIDAVYSLILSANGSPGVTSSGFSFKDYYKPSGSSTTYTSTYTFPNKTAANKSYTIATTDDLAGFVTGPNSVTTDGNIAIYDGTTGKIIKDSGIATDLSSTTRAINITGSPAAVKLASNNNYVEVSSREGLVSGESGIWHYIIDKIGNNTYYNYLPRKTGVLATTSDIINVVANPSSTTATLTGITIGDTSYAVSASSGDHYPTTFTWTNGTTAGPTGSLTGNSGFTAVSFGAIPSASMTQSGIVNTDTQAFYGAKTFGGHNSYGGGLQFTVASTGSAGSLTGNFNSSASTYPTIELVKSISFRQGNGSTHSAYSYSTTLIGSANSTANRTITLPDNTGTVALTSDLPQVIDLR